MTRPSPEEAAALRKERLEALHGQLVEQVDALTSSEGWKHMLQMAAKMHRYSFQNTLLILAQHENATQVAGYRTWQKLGRQVVKGAQAICARTCHVQDRGTERGHRRDASSLQAEGIQAGSGL